MGRESEEGREESKYLSVVKKNGGAGLREAKTHKRF